MVKQPLVSIILTCYNLESLIVQALDSIVNQTYSNLEIIVVDDCSKDGSRKVLKNYAKKDSRVKIIENRKNIGALKSKLLGVSLSQGEYFILCDGDDWIEPDLTEKCIYAIDDNDCIIFQFFSIDENTGVKKASINNHKILKKLNNNRELTEYQIGTISHLMQTFFYNSRIKKEYLEIYENILPIPYFEEIPIYLWTFSKCQVKLISDRLYNYRNNREGQCTATWFETNRSCKYQSLFLAIEQVTCRKLLDSARARKIAFYKILNISYYETIGLCKKNPSDYTNLKKIMGYIFNQINAPLIFFVQDIKLVLFYYCFRFFPVWVVHKLIIPAYKFHRKINYD